MAHLKRRMIHPDLFADPDFQPPAKALLYVGMMSVAEDSGCLPWRADLLRGLVLPFADVTADDVTTYMTALVDEGRAWTYSHSGRLYAFLPDFPAWQGKLIRWNAPDTVPLPSGIAFESYDAKERNGSGRYTWPVSRESLDPNALQELQALDLQAPDSKDATSLDLKEPASYQRAGSGSSEGQGQGRKEEEQLGPIMKLLSFQPDAAQTAALLALVKEHTLPVVEDAVFRLESSERGSATLPEIAKQIARLDAPSAIPPREVKGKVR